MHALAFRSPQFVPFPFNVAINFPGVELLF